LEDQTIEDVMAQLDDDLGATHMSARRTSRGLSVMNDDGPQRLALATWLSDWHLMWFLSTTGLISDVGGVANLFAPMNHAERSSLFFLLILILIFRKTSS